MTDATSGNGPASSGTLPKSMVLSYLTMRRILGILGFSLPIVLLVGGVLDECCVRPSISAYYYSPSPILHGLFVGTMSAIGVFLICYKGYPRTKGKFLGDNWIATLAGIGALGIAIFPTDPHRRVECSSEPSGAASCAAPVCESTFAEMVFGFLHNASALLFFAAAAAMACLLFTRSGKTEQQCGRKKFRNNIYWGCAALIVASIVPIVIETSWSNVIPLDFDRYSAVFGLEALAVWAFAAAWFVKGETLWTDKQSRETPDAGPSRRSDRLAGDR